jgi:hypothetical protein
MPVDTDSDRGDQQKKKKTAKRTAGPPAKRKSRSLHDHDDTAGDDTAAVNKWRRTNHATTVAPDVAGSTDPKGSVDGPERLCWVVRWGLWRCVPP